MWNNHHRIFGKKKDWILSQAITRMNPRDIMLSKKARHWGHILYKSTCMKCPEQANPERQKVDKWRPREGNWGMTANGFLFGVMRIFWNLNVVVDWWLCECSKITVNGLILWYVNYMLIKLSLKKKKSCSNKGLLWTILGRWLFTSLPFCTDWMCYFFS